MDIDRRSFLTGGLACAGLAVLPGKHPVADFNSTDDLAAIFGLHPFTVSLLVWVARARSAVERTAVEWFIRQREYLGHPLPPVIKWLPDPRAAFDHLSRPRKRRQRRLSPRNGRTTSAPHDRAFSLPQVRSLERRSLLEMVIEMRTASDDSSCQLQCSSDPNPQCNDREN
jgi:hypothetical protein